MSEENKIVEEAGERGPVQQAKPQQPSTGEVHRWEQETLAMAARIVASRIGRAAEAMVAPDLVKKSGILRQVFKKTPDNDRYNKAQSAYKRNTELYRLLCEETRNG